MYSIPFSITDINIVVVIVTSLEYTKDGLNTHAWYSSTNIKALNFQEYEYIYDYKVTVPP